MSIPQSATPGAAFAGIGGIASLFSAIGQYQSGQEQQAAYNYNAAITLQNMQQQEQTSQAKYSAIIGRQASSYARAGVDIASGSPLLVMAHTAAQGAIEQAREQQSGTEQSALQQYYGRIAAWTGTVGGISSFLSGLSKTGSQVAGMMSTGPSSGAGPFVDSPISAGPTYG